MSVLLTLSGIGTCCSWVKHPQRSRDGPKVPWRPNKCLSGRLKSAGVLCTWGDEGARPGSRERLEATAIYWATSLCARWEHRGQRQSPCSLWTEGKSSLGITTWYNGGLNEAQAGSNPSHRRPFLIAGSRLRTGLWKGNLNMRDVRCRACHQGHEFISAFIHSFSHSCIRQILIEGLLCAGTE